MSVSRRRRREGRASRQRSGKGRQPLSESPGYVVGAEPEEKRDLTIGSLPVWRIAQRVSVFMPVNEQQGDLAETRPGGG